MYQFRWITRAALAVGLVGALVTAPSVGGSQLVKGAEAMSVQSVPGSWATAITVLNPGTSPAAANVVVDFYDSAGVKQPSATVTQSVAPGTSAFWYVPNIAGLPAGNYSAVVSADQQVYATVNLGSTNPQTGETYNGVDQSLIAPSASAPSVLRNYHGFSSNLVVQNTGASAASVTVSFSGGNSAGPVTNVVTNPVSVAANASYILDLATLTNLGDGFNGAATVNGGGSSVAVIANNYTPLPLSSETPFSLFSSVNAVPNLPGTGSSTAFVPGLYNNYHGFVTALIVQNVDPSNAADVLVNYSNGSTDQVLGLAPGSSKVFYTPNVAGLPSGWIGSAKVTSTNGRNILATVNENATSGQVGLASYAGVTSGTTNLFAPGLLKHYSTSSFNTYLTIQNVDTVAIPAGAITTTYTNGVVRTSPALNPGDVWGEYTPNVPGIPDGYNGGATIVSTGGKITGLINIQGATAADQLFSTNTFGK